MPVPKSKDTCCQDLDKKPVKDAGLPPSLPPSLIIMNREMDLGVSQDKSNFLILSVRSFSH